jgi:hypothetical protein
MKKCPFTLLNCIGLLDESESRQAAQEGSDGILIRNASGKFRYFGSGNSRVLRIACRMYPNDSISYRKVVWVWTGAQSNDNSPVQLAVLWREVEGPFFTLMGSLRTLRFSRPA